MAGIDDEYELRPPSYMVVNGKLSRSVSKRVKLCLKKDREAKPHLILRCNRCDKCGDFLGPEDISHECKEELSMTQLALIVGDVKNCMECPLCSGVRCIPEGKKLLNEDAKNKRPDWCPLRDLSEEEVAQKKHEYIVALRCGGLMEDPDIYYKNHQKIAADSPEEAEKIYNTINNCNFYYGTVISQVR